MRQIDFTTYLSNASDTDTSVKNDKFSLTDKKFRQINSLVISLVKTLLSRNFCQKKARMGVQSSSGAHCGVCEIFVSRFFEKFL